MALCFAGGSFAANLISGTSELTSENNFLNAVSREKRAFGERNVVGMYYGSFLFKGVTKEVTKGVFKGVTKKR